MEGQGSTQALGIDNSVQGPSTAQAKFCLWVGSMACCCEGLIVLPAECWSSPLSISPALPQLCHQCFFP